MMGTNYAYLLKCADGTFYAGWTNDLQKRLKSHNCGKGSKYTKCRLPVSIHYYEEFETKHEAMQREAELKKLTHSQKQYLGENKQLN